MKNPLKAACLFICASALSASAATYQFYTNETEFLNALSGKPFYQENFASVPQTRFDTNSTNFSNGTFGFTATIPSTNPPTTSIWGETFDGNPALSTGNPPETMVLTNFSLNTFAFGGYFFPSQGNDFIDDGTPISISVLFSDLSSTNYTTNRGTFIFNDWFFGWITEEPGTALRSVTLDIPADDAFVSVSDVTLAVPEPSTYALLSIAAAGLAGYVIRRRRS